MSTEHVRETIEVRWLDPSTEGDEWRWVEVTLPDALGTITFLVTEDFHVIDSSTFDAGPRCFEWLAAQLGGSGA